MDFIELLTQFNLTRQEALIYHSLLTEGDLNGYEAAKVTGISRSNTYTSLAALVEKGAAYVIEGSVVKYTPVGLEEFCNNKLKKLSDSKKELMINPPVRKDDSLGYITVKGENCILNKMANMIAEANERVYLSAAANVIEKILVDIKLALDKGIKVVLISNMNFSLEKAKIYITEKSHQQIRLIVDSTNVLTGDIDDGDASTCLYSRKKNLIDLLKDSLKNEIKLIEIMKGQE